VKRDKGILQQIPAASIIAALDKLPDCRTAESDIARLQMDVPGFGLVDFIFERAAHRLVGAGERFWIPTHAKPAN
jgi:hypothetical protein